MGKHSAIVKWTLTIGVVIAALLSIPTTWLSQQFTAIEFSKAQNAFLNQEQEAYNQIQTILGEQPSNLFKNQALTVKGVTYLVFKSDTLVYWSDDKVNASFDELTAANGQLIKTGTGYYYITTIQKDKKTGVSAILVQQSFHHENNYLNTKFQFSNSLDEVYNFSTATSGELKFKNLNGDLIFSLSNTHFSNGYKLINTWNTLLLLMLILVGCFLIYFLCISKPILSLCIFIGIGLLQVTAIHLHFPDFLYRTALFSPTILAVNEYFPSFGVTIINTIILLFLFLSVFSLISKLLNNVVGFICSIVIIYFLGFSITKLIRGFVIDSALSFDLTNLFQLTGFSYLGLLLIAVLFFGLFNFANRTVGFSNLSVAKKAGLILCFALLNYFVQYLFGERNIAFINWPLLLLLFTLFINSRFNDHYNLTRSLFLILIFSAIGSYILVHQTAQKDRRAMEVLAQKLAEEKDPIAEYLFQQEVNKVKSDTTLKSMLQQYWLNTSEVDNYLREEYFNGYWQGFDFQFTVCYYSDELLIQPDNQKMNCIDFFDQRIESEGDRTGSFPLFQMQTETGRISYLSKIEVPLDTSIIVLFIEFNNRRFNQNEGYPELLLAQKEISRSIDLQNFSFAKYDNTQLVSSVGSYDFSARLEVQNLNVGQFLKKKQQDRDLLFHRVNETSTIQLASPSHDWLDRFTSFAYLFSFLAICLFLVALLLPDFPIYVSWRINDFTTKIQLFIVGILLVSIGLFSIASTYYIKQQYQSKNEKNIAEKLRSVLIEVNQKFGAEKQLDDTLNEYITSTLIKFSNVFYTDINLYDKRGQLIATSRSEVFDIGLKANIMDDAAFDAMAFDNKQLFINNERIGGLNYLSAYVPFYNIDGQFLAYLNLPYFAKQNELEAEIASFLVSSVNIYVLIFAFSIILSVLFANYISQPLRLLREKIAQLNIGESNELIKWEGTDEIGSLVKEYNRMVVKLADSVDVLARSERAGAWKEMAKQVAHEIKNPLTPMKLSIQYLKRASDDQREDLSQRIDKTAETLIQQIDALAQIADEFSNFAKMPEPRKKPIDFLPILNNAVNLYDELENISLETTLREAIVLADKDQLIRVFNNIIKNGFQAVPEGRKPKIRIEVALDPTGEKYSIKIQDNGQGIAEADYDRIFVPNFTSKSSGMGLGLAIVKNVVEQSNGQIYFESVINEGTTFVISLPRLKSD
jgi:signal transduction histidine kinase